MGRDHQSVNKAEWLRRGSKLKNNICMQSAPRAPFDSPLLNVNCAMTVAQTQSP